ELPIHPSIHLPPPPPNPFRFRSQSQFALLYLAACSCASPPPSDLGPGPIRRSRLDAGLPHLSPLRLRARSNAVATAACVVGSAAASLLRFHGRTPCCSSQRRARNATTASSAATEACSLALYRNHSPAAEPARWPLLLPHRPPPVASGNRADFRLQRRTRRRHPRPAVASIKRREGGCRRRRPNGDETCSDAWIQRAARTDADAVASVLAARLSPPIPPCSPRPADREGCCARSSGGVTSLPEVRTILVWYMHE
ncbi:unnamed protein product, partial [Urochloa humidicola]